MANAFPSWFDPFLPDVDNPLHEGLTEREIDHLQKAGRERLDSDDVTSSLWAIRDDPAFEKARLEGLQRYQLDLRAKRIKRQERLLDLLEGGYSTDEACWQVNVTKATFYKWCSVDKDFDRDAKNAKRAGQVLVSGVHRDNARALPFHILRKRCFGRETFGYQQKIIDIIEDAPMGEVTMILLPPGVGKTMTLEDWLTLELAKDQSLRCMYISETGDLGERTMEVIKSRFENEDGDFNTLTDLFGTLYDEDNGKKWAAREIRMPMADIGNRDYSLRSRGMNSQIYSIRGDIIVLDDIQTMKTIKLTEKYLRDLRRTILTRREGAIEGKVIYIGTRLEIGDLPSVMIEEGVVLPENLFVMPLVNSEGTSNFEDVIATSSLPILIRQMGSEFQGVYQQNPAGGKQNTFKDAVRRVTNRRYTIGTWNEAHLTGSEPQEILGRIISIDPALVGGNAILALGYSMTDIWMYDLDFKFDVGKMSYSEDKIEDFVLGYQATDLIIEDKAYQKALFTSERIEQICGTYGVKLHPHTTGSEKHDPVFGVAKMEGPMAFGRIHMPWGDAYSKQTFGPMRDQLQAWRADLPTKSVVQDCVMALWFPFVHIYRQRALLTSMRRAEEMKQDSMRRHGVGNRPRGLPGGKTRYARRH